MSSPEGVVLEPNNTRIVSVADCPAWLGVQASTLTGVDVEDAMAIECTHGVMGDPATDPGTKSCLVVALAATAVRDDATTTRLDAQGDAFQDV